MPEQSKLYSIGEAVAQLQRSFPDVTHSSLRFLQREGLIDPVRTPGGHRLFRQSDLDRIRRIKGWQAERLSLAEIRERLDRLGSLPSPRTLSRRFLDLALTGHGGSAIEELLAADTAGMPMETLYEEVLRPALYEVGDRWHGGSLGVDQEHEITEIVRDVITELTARHVRDRPAVTSAVAACVADEVHDIGLRMITSLLRAEGAEVHFLGPSVPPSSLATMVRRRAPEAVLLSVTHEAHWPAVVASIRAIREGATDGEGPRVVVGGQGCIRKDDALRKAEITALGACSLASAVDDILRPAGA